MRRTDSRALAIKQVIEKEVFYDTSDGDFTYRDGSRVNGSARRTFSELMRYGLVSSPDEPTHGRFMLVLSEHGRAILPEWGLLNPGVD